MFLRPRTLRVLRGVSQQHVRAFGFSSSSGNSPMSPMGNIPMPYIEESSVSYLSPIWCLRAANNSRLPEEKHVCSDWCRKWFKKLMGYRGYLFQATTGEDKL
jgi:hypothetical protein